MSTIMDYLERNYLAVLELLDCCKKRFDNFAFPIKQHHEFDVIGLENGECKRIRVICTESKNPSGAYVANLLKSGAHENNKSIKKSFSNKDCDYLFVLTPIGKYLIPTEEITQTKAITMSMFSSFALV